MATWIVAYDFSRPAQAALEEAAPLLTRAGVKLQLTHVHPVARVLPQSQSGAVTYAEEEELRRALSRVASELSQSYPGLSVDVAVVTGDSPANALLDEVERTGAAGIVIGTHGRTGLSHLVLGSVAERVVQRATVPVLVAARRNN